MSNGKTDRFLRTRRGYASVSVRRCVCVCDFYGQARLMLVIVSANACLNPRAFNVQSELRSQHTQIFFLHTSPFLVSYI